MGEDQSDHVTKIKENSYTIRKELYGVRLEDASSVEAYAQRIQQAIDQFNRTAEEDSEKMSGREHSSLLLDGTNPAVQTGALTYSCSRIVPSPSLSIRARRSSAEAARARD